MAFISNEEEIIINEDRFSKEYIDFCDNFSKNTLAFSPRNNSEDLFELIEEDPRTYFIEENEHNFYNEYLLQEYIGEPNDSYILYEQEVESNFLPIYFQYPDDLHYQEIAPNNADFEVNQWFNDYFEFLERQI